MPDGKCKPPNHDRSLKRGRTEVSFSRLPPITSTEPDNYSRFLIIEYAQKENPITSQSVFLISKFLENIVAKPIKVKKQRTGELLVELTNQLQDTRLHTQTSIADLDIRITPHRSLNSSHGVISETDLINETDAELLEGLEIKAGGGEADHHPERY